MDPSDKRETEVIELFFPKKRKEEQQSVIEKLDPIVTEVLMEKEGNSCLSPLSFKFFVNLLLMLNEGFDSLSRFLNVSEELYNNKMCIGVYFSKNLTIDDSYWSELKKMKHLSVVRFIQGSKKSLGEKIEKLMKEKFGENYKFTMEGLEHFSIVPCIGINVGLYWPEDIKDVSNQLFWEINKIKPQRYAQMFSGRLSKIGIVNGVRIFEIKTKFDCVITIFTRWSEFRNELFSARRNKYTREDFNQLKDIVFNKNVLTNYKIEEYLGLNVVEIPKVEISTFHCLNVPSNLREKVFMNPYIINKKIHLYEIYLGSSIKMGTKGIRSDSGNTGVPRLTLNEPFVFSFRDKYGLVAVGVVTEPIWAK